MKATLRGRVVSVEMNQALGCITNVRIDSKDGMVCIYKPDAWWNEPAEIKALLGEQVTVIVGVTHDR